MKKICRVLLVEDEHIIRGFYKTIFKEVSNTSGVVFTIQESTSCREVYEYTQEKKLDVDFVILNLSIPSFSQRKSMSSLDIGKMLKRENPDIKIAVVSSLNV